MKLSFFLFFIFSVNLFCPIQVFAQTWDPLPVQFDSPAGSPDISCFYLSDSILYFGGGFIKDSIKNNIATWDGQKIDSLDGGLNGPMGGWIKSITKFQDVIYAGGNFSVGYGLPFDSLPENLAWWDGNKWNQALIDVVTNTTCEVYALGVYKNELYVSGLLRHLIDTTETSYKLVRYDGAKWQNVVDSEGDSIHIGGPVWIDDMVIYNNELYVGGSFAIIGDAAYNLARWGGSGWRNLGGYNVSGMVEALEVDTINNILYIGGDYLYDSLGNATIFSWDGSKLKAIQGGGVSKKSLGLYHGELYAGINTISDKISRWDGKTWRQLGSGLNKGAGGLGVYHDTLFVGGAFTRAGGKKAIGLCRWYTPPCAALVGDIGLQNDTVYLSEGATVQFYDSSASLNRNWWSWDFGDGDTGNVKNPAHNYDSAGIYSVRMIVGFTYDNCIDTAYKTVVVELSDINEKTVKEKIFKIYPNPLKKELIIEIATANEKSFIEKYIVKIKNSSSQEVFNQTFSKKIIIDTSKFQKGLYLLEVGNAEGMMCYTEKVIIE